MKYRESAEIENKIAGVEPAIILWKILYPVFCYLQFLSYICIELFDEMQAQRFSAVALLLNRYQLLSFSLLNAVIQADMQKFLIRCKDNTTRTQNQTCPGFSGGVRRP